MELRWRSDTPYVNKYPSSLDDAPNNTGLTRLEQLVRNCYSMNPDHIRMVGLRMVHDITAPIPSGMETMSHPLWSHGLTWDDQTGAKLQRIIDEDVDPGVTSFAKWTLDAWNEWQEGKNT